MDQTIETISVVQEGPWNEANLARRQLKALDSKHKVDILNFARLIKNPELEDTCVKAVRKNAGTILHTEEFLHCERDTLDAILRMDELTNVDEVQLFRACTRWATAHSQGIKTPRAVLGPALQLIRFRTMSAEQFAEHVCPTKILTPEEQSVILQCIVTGKDEFMPQGFSIETRPRGEEFRVGTAVEVELNWSVCQFRTAGEIAASPLRISVSADAYILGVKLRAWREGKRQGERYDQNVEVTLKDNDGIDLTSASFVGLVKNCDWITLWFERPYAIYAEAIYTVHLIYSEPQVRHWCWAYQKQTKKIYSGMEFCLLEQVQSTRIHCIVAEKIRV
ncbi:hypothetical protein B566_EDAN010118 [Ephemera danica]|nr:hypothetical protein B566_EDAN010118 [Ephemera danica]